MEKKVAAIVAIGSLATCWVLLGMGGGRGLARAAELRLFVYNTHGLPALFAGDDPHGRFPEIGRHTQRYDLSLLQEDFAHHDRLVEGLGEVGLVERGNESRMCWCFFCSGSGLTTISRLRADWEVSVTSYAYDACSGWLAGANDCLATKGLQVVRLTTPEGARLHVVQTHLDAGSGRDDREARKRQLESIREVVVREVGEGALVVAGDLNLDASHPDDRALFDDFAGDLALRDSGARATPGSDWEVLDYILYRSGPDTEVRVREAGEDRALVWEGRALSDHPALFAVLDVEPRERSEVQGE